MYCFKVLVFETKKLSIQNPLIYEKIMRPKSGILGSQELKFNIQLHFQFPYIFETVPF